MAATVQIDILEGTAASHDILRGWEITRIAVIESGLQAAASLTLAGSTTLGSGTVTMASTLGVLMGMSVAGTGIPAITKVTGITTNTNIVLSNAATESGTLTLSLGSLDTAGLMAAAEGLVIAVTGDRGSVCPNVGVPTYLKSFTPTLIGTDAAFVKIAYQGYPLPKYDFDSQLNDVQSNLDVNGSLITTSYTYPLNYPYDYRYRGTTKPQGGMISRPVPESTVNVQWLITDGFIAVGTVSTPATATQIVGWWKAFEGKVNSTSYTIGPLMGAARCWRFDKIHCVSNDGGRTYEASALLHLKRNTWDTLVVYMDPNTGMPPPDLVAGVGYKMVATPEETAFPSWTFPPN
jgi:hypothetical protein